VPSFCGCFDVVLPLGGGVFYNSQLHSLTHGLRALSIEQRIATNQNIDLLSQVDDSLSQSPPPNSPGSDQCAHDHHRNDTDQHIDVWVLEAIFEIDPRCAKGKRPGYSPHQRP